MLMLCATICVIFLNDIAMRRFICLLGCICACWANDDNKCVELRNYVELFGKKYVIEEYCEEIDKINKARDQKRLTREMAIEFFTGY